MASIISNRFLYSALNAIAGHTIKAAILANTYTPDKDHNTFADVSAHEVSGTNYTAGGQALSNLAATEDDANDKAVLDCDDLVWPNVTFTNGRYLVLYDTTDSNNLIAVYDFGADKSPAADDFNANINASGLLDLSQV